MRGKRSMPGRSSTTATRRRWKSINLHASARSRASWEHDFPGDFVLVVVLVLSTLWRAFDLDCHWFADRETHESRCPPLRSMTRPRLPAAQAQPEVLRVLVIP